MTEPALQRLEAELRDVRVVIALGRLNQLRTHEPAKIDCLNHGNEILENGQTADAAPTTPYPAPDAR